MPRRPLTALAISKDGSPIGPSSAPHQPLVSISPEVNTGSSSSHFTIYSDDDGDDIDGLMTPPPPTTPTRQPRRSRSERARAAIAAHASAQIADPLPPPPHRRPNPPSLSNLSSASATTSPPHDEPLLEPSATGHSSEDATQSDPDADPDPDPDPDANLENAPPPSPTSSPLYREISPLASWTVSTHKPGCGIPALLAPSPQTFWQSDGPQPHLLTMHFFKLVTIVRFRLYLDFELDESYTPTRMVFLAGHGAYDLTEFAVWVGEQPRGWVEVDLSGVGGARRGLRCMVVQVQVVENHQNGKDTHIRGVQVFARDERWGLRRGGGLVEREEEDGGDDEDEEMAGLEEPDWMAEPEIR
ncbi:MAG: hypothetical protein LQ342_005060 [Letrouitia transgressa]|nr:MAG: hypothetical protein LQ342_005060 [Letrouitia transgressa]